MPLSDEKLEQILSVMVDSFQAFQATQAATAQMNSELFKMLEKQISVQEASMNMNADIRMLKSEMNMNGTGDGTGQGLTTPKKFSNKARPKRPVVEGDIDDVEWGIFIDKWKIYKSIAELEEHEICMELRETCSPAVYKLLYQFLVHHSLTTGSKFVIYPPFFWKSRGRNTSFDFSNKTFSQVAYNVAIYIIQVDTVFFQSDNTFFC